MYDTDVLKRAAQSQEAVLKYVNIQLRNMRSDNPQARKKLMRRKEQTELIIMLIDDKLNEENDGYMSFGEEE